MLPADGVVGDGKLPAVAADEDGCVGQFKSPTFVRTLQYEEGEHSWSLSLQRLREKGAR
jgi:hypothetical protein